MLQQIAYIRNNTGGKAWRCRDNYNHWTVSVLEEMRRGWRQFSNTCDYSFGLVIELLNLV